MKLNNISELFNFLELLPLKHVKEIKKDDDRDRQADQPKQYSFHNLLSIILVKALAGTDAETANRLQAGWVIKRTGTEHRGFNLYGNAMCICRMTPQPNWGCRYCS
jgi:hypothetical protein